MIKESHIQIACNDLLNQMANVYCFRHFHVPNEGKRSMFLHNHMKRMGLKSGCPDLIIEYPKGRIMYVELKTKNGRLTPAQKLWAVQSSVYETPHYIVKGNIDECLNELKDIIEKNVPKRS